MSYQGKQLSTEFEELVVQLKKYFDKERKTKFVSTNDPAGRTAEALGIGVRTVKRIMSMYYSNGEKVDPKPTWKPGKEPNHYTSLQPIVREFIRIKNLNGQKVSLESVKAFLDSECKIHIPKTTLWRVLKRWGFTHGEGRRRDSLKEQDRVVIARREYLRKRLANRNPDGSLKKPEVFLDETYINKNHSSRFTWYLEEDGPWVNKPSGVGPRLIIVHAITKDGWVDGAKLVFTAKKRTGDYHGQMNWDNFSKWFREQLMPNIPQDSIIILDNAQYHNVLTQTFPNKNSSKVQLQNWLSAHDFSWNEDMLKSELYERCEELAPAPEYCLDFLASEYGFSILRTPPYHPELQPIETCWAIVKNYVADNCDFTMKGLHSKLPAAFGKVTPHSCKKIIRKVIEQEEKYWREDEELDELEDYRSKAGMI